jgi:hypothetical protein
MRKKIIIIITLLALVGVFATILLMPAKPKAGPWKLSDGSELSLAGVTHGTNHTMRYGKRFVDYLYPILTPALRKRFKCQVATMPGGAQSGVVVWFWNKGSRTTSIRTGPTAMPMPMFFGQSAFTMVTVDENGMESASFPYGQWGWSSGSNVLGCWALQQFPRRSKEVKVRIYNNPNNVRWDSQLGVPVAEFTIPNPMSTNYPVWEGKPAPLVIGTNGLSVTLAKFEVGVTASRLYAGAGSGKMASRAEIEISETPGPLEWELHSGVAKSATGESHWSSVSPRAGTGSGAIDRFPAGLPGDTSQAVVEFPGTCWLQEPAWKLVLEFGRITNFLPEEVWTIKGIKIPALGEFNELNLKTNINGGEIEFLGLSSKFSAWGSMPGSGTYPSDHEIKVRSPLRTTNAHLKVASILDDRGRGVGFRRVGSTVHRPSGPPTPYVSLEESFALDISDDAKSIDVTLAYPKSQFVEFLARPTKASESK